MKLRPGMVLAVEPMVNQGTEEVEVFEDDWTAVTVDSKLSAHFEHTVLIREGRPEILTPGRGRWVWGIRSRSGQFVEFRGFQREDACHFRTKVLSRRASRVQVVRKRVSDCRRMTPSKSRGP
jgi:hypothetical protein